jgi:hypothetical protein
VSEQSIDSIIARLEEVSAELGDHSIALLRDAIESGDTARPAGEKTVSQARRAVDKAINLLAGLSSSSD